MNQLVELGLRHSDFLFVCREWRFYSFLSCFAELLASVKCFSTDCYRVWLLSKYNVLINHVKIIAGPDATICELTDFIGAAQISKADDAMFAEMEEKVCISLSFLLLMNLCCTLLPNDCTIFCGCYS